MLVSNASGQCMDAPSVVDLSTTRVGVTWEEFPGAISYKVQESNLTNPDIFLTVFLTFDASVRLNVEPETPAFFRIVTTGSTGDLCTSESASFPGTVPLSSTPVDNSPIDGPSFVQVSSKFLSASWPAFGPSGFEYSLEIYQSGGWISIFARHAYDGENMLTALVDVSYAGIIPGLPYFFRVSAGGISTASTIFSLSSETSSGGYDPSFVIVNELLPLEATLISSDESNNIGLVTETRLGGTKGTEMLIRYEVAINFKECSFLHAKLEWRDPLIANYTLLNGNHLRAYAALESNWAVDTVTHDTSPQVTDANYYLSDVQVTKNNSVVTLPLDHYISEDLFIASYVHAWAAGEENRGLLLTLHPASGKIILPGLPSLIVATSPPESTPTVLTTEIEFPNGPSVQGGSSCSFCGPSLCNFDPQWNENISLVSALAIPVEQTVFQVEIFLNGNFNSDPNSAGRITISLNGALIADSFLEENSLNCDDAVCKQQTFLSPVYPLLSGGWPAFDYETIENNNISIVYTDDICIHSMEVFLFVATPNDPNCPSASPTPTPSISVPKSSTPSPSISKTVSDSSSVSPSRSPSRSRSPSFTSSISETPSSSSSPSVTKTINFTESNSPSTSVSPSLSASTSLSASISISSSPSTSLSSTLSPSTSISQSRSIGSSASPSTSVSTSPSISPSTSPSKSLFVSDSSTASISGSASNTRSSSLSPSESRVLRSPSVTSFHSMSFSRSTSSTVSPSHSLSQSATASESESSVVSSSASASASASFSNSPSSQESTSLSASKSAVASKSPSGSPSESRTKSNSAGISQILIGPSSSTTPHPSIIIVLPSTTTTPSRSVSVLPIHTRAVQEETIPITENTDILIVDNTGFIIGSVQFLGDTNDRNLSISNPTIAIPENEEIASEIFDLSLRTTGGVTQEVTADVKICINVVGEKIKTEDFCLGFIDESKTPPRWVCQDSCLEKERDKLCGITDHFTSFALLLTGKGQDGCGDSGEGDFIFHSEWQDSLLIASVTLFVIFCLICAVFLLSWCPKGSDLVYGKEGARVKQLRRSHSIQMVDMGDSQAAESDFV